MRKLAVLFFCLCFFGGTVFAEKVITFEPSQDKWSGASESPRAQEKEIRDYWSVFTFLAGSYVFKQEGFWRTLDGPQTMDQASASFKEFDLSIQGYIQKAKAVKAPEDLRTLQDATAEWFGSAQIFSQTASEYLSGKDISQLALQGPEKMDHLGDLLADVVKKYKNWVQEWTRLKDRYNLVAPLYFMEKKNRYPNDILKYMDDLYASLDSLVFALEGVGMFDEGMKFFLKIYPFDPESSNLNWYIGTSYQFEGGRLSLDQKTSEASAIATAKAKPFLLKVASLNPNDWNANYNAGRTCLDMEDYPEALDFLMKAGRLNPNDEEVQVQIGRAYLYGYKDEKKALEHFAKAKQLKADDWVIYWYTAAVYAYLKDYDDVKQNLTLVKEYAQKWSNYQKAASDAGTLIKLLSVGDIKTVEASLLNKGQFKK